MLIGMPLYNQVNMLDVTGAYEMFRWAKFTVELVAETPREITCAGGLKVRVDTGFKDAGAYDVLWVPGGTADDIAVVMNEPKRTFLDFLIAQSERPGLRYLSSVCEGSLLLAAAGLLDGYTATTHWQYYPCMTKLFPKVKLVKGYPRFHLDRNRMTGGGVSSGLDEALELIKILKGAKLAEEVQRITQYYPKPPVSSTIVPAKTCTFPPVHIPPRHAKPA